MGVTGLWQLLEPVGRRISIEALQNKRLAVDASMWLFQFVRAMRDDRGEMVRNAHVIGFFRRICKLLFHRIRPVFVFDGSTPALKQQTVAARRRRREQQSARVNRLAEKLLLNQLKQSVIGKVTEAQLRKAVAGRGQGRGRGRGGRGRGRAALAAAEQSSEEQQEQALEGGGGGGGAAAAAAAAGAPEQPPVGASAQASTARPGARNGVRSQRTDSVAVPAAAPLVAAAGAAAAGGRHPEDGPSTSAAAAAASTAADELLAAQLAAEQWDEEEAVTVAAVAAAATRGAGGTSLQLPSVFSTLSEQRQQERARRRATRAGGKGSDAEESSGEEDDLEIVLPEHGQLDPAVMSTLPPSVALDLMMKMRERSQAENRQEFEARRAAPAAFSSFQMQTYLAGTRFRQQVSDVKDAMNASAAGGSAARRIAGEAGREYVLHKDPQLLQKEAAAGAAAAVAAGSQNAAAAGADGGGHAQPAAEASPAAAARASLAAPAAVPSPAVTALGAPPAAVPGLSGSPLDICFDVEVGESDDDLGWEDIEQASPSQAQQEGQQQQGAPQHWRQRAAQRQKYWSLSHGFQMGRKLAAWGEGEPEEGPPEAEEGPEPEAGAAADGATPAPRKRLIGRSPPSRSPVKPVPEDEDGQLQEAIRRSLEEVTPGKGGQAADGSGRRLSLDSMETGTPKPAAPTLAAEAARMLEQRQRLLQLVQPQQGQQQAQQLPSGAATEVVDLTGADEARAAYGSGSEAELLLEDTVVAAAEADAAAGSQQAQQLRATINEQSAQRLEEWLGGGSKSAAAATTPTRVAAAEDDDDDGMLWEDAEPAPLAAQNGTTSLRIPGVAAEAAATEAAATEVAAAEQGQRTASAAAQAEADIDWEDADAAAEVAGKPAQSQPLQAELQRQPPHAGGQQLGPAQAEPQQQQTRARTTAAAAAAAAAGTLSERATAQHAPQPAPMSSQMPRPPLIQQQQQHEPQTMPELQPAAPLSGMPNEPRSAAPARGPVLERAAPAYAAFPATARTDAAQIAEATRAAQQATTRAAAALPAAEVEASLGGFTAAELEELALLEEGGEEAWEPLVEQPGHQHPCQQHQHEQQLHQHQHHQHHQQHQQSPQQQEGQPEWEGQQEEGQPLDFEAQLEALQAEERAMKAAQRKGQGQSDQPTQDMYQDCMELLQMFGLPYIIAPQEAEAQCAWLDYNGLVDGVVTDDNDVFLFGALRVYRHIFESKKYVEEYRSEDVQSELGVGRAELARLAQLLGGDYCEGVAGVGIVNAMEIVHAFPGPHGLRRFREWLDAPDEELVELAKGKSGKPGSASKPGRSASKQRRGRSSAVGGDEEGAEDEAQGGGRGGQTGAAGPAGADGPGDLRGSSQEEGQESDPEAAARLEAFKRTHRGVRRSWDPPASFPSAAVDQAYAEPKVDTSKEKFTFGRPDVELLRQFCQTRLGWTSQQADDLLLPVAKAFDQRQSQLTLDSFLTKRERFAKIRSKRLQQAVTGVAGGDREELMLKDGEQTKPVGGGSTKGRKRKTTDAAANAADSAAGSQHDSGDGYAAPQQQQQQQEPQDLDTGGLHPSQSKRQRRPAADGGPGRGRTGRGATGGRGRGRGRRPGSKGQAAASDDIDCDAASGLPAAGQPGHGDPQDEQQQQQQQSYERGPTASQSTGEPNDQSRSSQPARRQPSRGRRAVVVLPLPDDA